MMIVSGGDVGGLVGLDHSGHIEDFGFPVVFPAGNRPKQTFISDSESHLLSISIFINESINIYKSYKSSNESKIYSISHLTKQ
jgi:hypothetical protein